MIDRGPLDSKNVIAMIKKIKNNNYKIGYKSGQFKCVYQRAVMQKLKRKEINLNDIPSKKKKKNQ